VTLQLKPWQMLSGAVLIGLVVAGAWLTYSMTDQSRTAPTSLTVADECALDKQACTAQGVNGEQLSLSLAPKPVPVLEDVRVTLQQLQGLGQLRQAEVSVEGVNMFMGYQSTALQAKPGQQWQGIFVLPICSSSVMQWQLSLDLQTSSGHYQAIFPFQTYGQ